MNIAFIHIGKTGGTTIFNILQDKLTKIIRYHVWKETNGINNYKSDEKYIIWIRNPISRFVSAFNQSYYAVNTDSNMIKSFDLSNCLLPSILSGAAKRSYIFSNEYDSLVKHFKSANHLAESLSSNNLESRRKAHALMSYPIEHLHRGIGWYLENGEFIKNNSHKIIFVGRQEYMKDDIKRLSSLLNVDLDETTKLRENVYLDKSMKYLSPLAINNIINWYKDTDYAALQELCRHGWINQNLLSSYYTYNLPDGKLPAKNSVYLKCRRSGCNYIKHHNLSNNGGTHCCLACKEKNKHGPHCKKLAY
jgi:hypothetical protein